MSIINYNYLGVFMKLIKFVSLSAISMILSCNAFAETESTGDFYVIPVASITLNDDIKVHDETTTALAPAAVATDAASAVTFTVNATAAWTGSTSGCDDYKGGSLDHASSGTPGIGSAGTFDIQFVGLATAATTEMATCTLTVTVATP